MRKRSLVLAVVLAVIPLMSAGCGGVNAVRPVDSIEAEERTFKAVAPWRDAFKEKYPHRAQEADDLYETWGDRLSKEKTAAGK